MILVILLMGFVPSEVYTSKYFKTKISLLYFWFISITGYLSGPISVYPKGVSVRKCAYQWVRIASFSENFVYILSE